MQTLFKNLFNSSTTHRDEFIENIFFGIFIKIFLKPSVVKIIIICEARYYEKTRLVKETLRKLAEDREATVRINVAGNYHTPEETLDELPNDKDMMVRINPKNTI